MAKLTLARMERHLVVAADIMRGGTEALENRDLLFALLFLKHVNDEFEAVREAVVADGLAAGDSQEEAEAKAKLREHYRSRGVVYVPEKARWRRLSRTADSWTTENLSNALSTADWYDADGVGLHGLFDHVSVSHPLSGGAAAVRADKQLTAVIEHFGRVRLRKDDFAFPGLLGAAYEYLLKLFADAAGNKGGEFYTPRTVVRMMVELAQPHGGMRIYDPCAGSGGMLVQAREYVEGHGEDPGGLFLAGQDANSGSWRMATLNMLFHGAASFSLKTGDTLTGPEHRHTDFDLVLSNPPFSMDYRQSEVPDLAERMPYGVTSERGRADLMFLQHMLDRVRGRGGSVVTVMPYGVLFRGGAEQSIRAELLHPDLDLLEAVIGLGPNLFYGTGIPACVMVLRAPGKKAPERRGKVLFINADREFHAERAQNVLLPEHIEKISTTFHAFEDVDGFARVVGLKELDGDRFDLSPHRYVDNTPPPEPQDIRAHLEGGVPVAEIEARRPLFDAYGITMRDLFAPREYDPAYVDFLPVTERPDAARLALLADGTERKLWAAFEEWWQTAADRIASLERDARPAAVRADVLDTFRDQVLRAGANGVLDRYASVGAATDWWYDVRNELETLSAHGFEGVVDSWIGTVKAVLPPAPGAPTGGDVRGGTAAERRQAYDHKVVAAIAPDFLEDLAAAQRTYEERDAEFRAAREAEAALAAARAAAEASGDPEDVDSELTKVVPDAAAMRTLLRQRTAAKKTLLALEDDFWPCLERARNAVAEAAGERDVVLGILRDGLASRLERLVALRRHELVRTYERWEEKYQLSFREIENQLYGTSAGMAQNNPWSRSRAWDLSGESARSASGREQMKAVVDRLIDAEKFAEGALAKLEFDELTGPFALLAPGAVGEDGVRRRTLGEVLVSARTGSWGRTSETADAIPVIDASNLTAGGLDLSRLRRLAPTQRPPGLEYGDVLLSAVTADLSFVGLDQGFRVAVWQEQLPRATFGPQILCLRPHAGLLSSHYLAAWLRLPPSQRRIFGVARTLLRGTTVLDASRLLDVEIELPGVADQRSLDRQAAILHEQRRVRHRQLAKLRLIRETLTRVLTG